MCVFRLIITGFDQETRMMPPGTPASEILKAGKLMGHPVNFPGAGIKLTEGIAARPEPCMINPDRVVINSVRGRIHSDGGETSSAAGELISVKEKTDPKEGEPLSAEEESQSGYGEIFLLAEGFLPEAGMICRAPEISMSARKVMKQSVELKMQAGEVKMPTDGESLSANGEASPASGETCSANQEQVISVPRRANDTNLNKIGRDRSPPGKSFPQKTNY